MTRIIRIETCAECPFRRAGGCMASPILVGGILHGRKIPGEQIPAWCPLDVEISAGSTIDIYGPPRYARSTTEGSS